MSKDKQIEDIFEIITTDCDHKCDDCEFNKSEWCFTHYASARIYSAGYRKQSEGEWIRKDGFQVCSNCDATKPIAFSTVLKITYYRCDYCPKCGAKMKGGE